MYPTDRKFKGRTLEDFINFLKTPWNYKKVYVSYESPENGCLNLWRKRAWSPLKDYQALENEP